MTTSANWRTKTVDELPIPSATRKHLERLDIRTYEDVALAFDNDRDIGLGELQERIRAVIEDERTTERTGAEPANANASAPPVTEAALPADAGVETANVAAEPAPSPAKKRAKTPAAESNNLDDIGVAWKRAHKAKQRMEQTKAAAKAAKAEYEEAMLDFYDTADPNRAARLFDESDDSPASQAGDEDGSAEADDAGAPSSATEAASAATANTGEVNPDDDAWRTYPLARFEERFGLAIGIIKALADNVPPIVTVGDVMDWTKPDRNNYTKQLTDIKGIGEGKRTKIEDALTQFWQAWNVGLAAAWRQECAEAEAKKAGAA